jgi:drug/metabolite transporter (DMT)-like permease
MPTAAASDAEPGFAVPRSTLVILALGSVYVIWSSTYLALRFVVEEMAPLGSAGVRFLVAGVILYAFLRWRGAPAPTRREWLMAFPIGALMFLIGNGFVSLAETSVSSGSAAVMVATMPLFAAVLGLPLGERPRVREWVGLILGFAGVVVLSLGSDLRSSPKGALLLLLSPIGWALGSMIQRRVQLPKGLMAAATQMIGGSIALLLAGVAMGESLPTHVSAKAIWSLVYLVTVGSLLGYTAYSWLLRNTPAPLAMSYAYVNPAIAVFLGVALGAETLFPSTMGATVLIVAGVALLVTARRPAKLPR